MQFRINSFLVALAAMALLVGTANVTQADLIAHWAFDEGATATTAVDSADSHDGAIDTTSGYGPTLNQAGKIGKSYLFSGSNSHAAGEGGVSVPQSSELEGFTNVTFSQWFRITAAIPAGARQLRRIICNSSGSSSPGKSYVTWFETPLGSNIGAELGGPLNDNRLWVETPYAGYLDGDWHQMTVTYSMEGVNEVADVYLDGLWKSQTTQTDGSGIYVNGLGVMLGAGFRAGSSDSAFDGYLDDLGIWGETLTAGKAISTFTVVDDLGLAYNLSAMEKLFDVYDTGASDTVGGLVWEKDTALPGGHLDGDAWSDGSYYYVQLETGSAMGVKAAIPEPSTLLLLATGLLGLLAYAWRKRK